MKITLNPPCLPAPDPEVSRPSLVEAGLRQGKAVNRNQIALVT